MTVEPRRRSLATWRPLPDAPLASCVVWCSLRRRNRRRKRRRRRRRKRRSMQRRECGGAAGRGVRVPQGGPAVARRCSLLSACCPLPAVRPSPSSALPCPPRSSGGARKRKAGGSGSSLGSYLSPEMQEFLGDERLPRTQVGAGLPCNPPCAAPRRVACKRWQPAAPRTTPAKPCFCPRPPIPVPPPPPLLQVVKRLWAYIKENDLQNPKDKREILFGRSLTEKSRRRCSRARHPPPPPPRRRAAPKPAAVLQGADAALHWLVLPLVLCRRQATGAVPRQEDHHVQAAEAAVKALQDQRWVLLLPAAFLLNSNSSAQCRVRSMTCPAAPRCA